ncbi:MAG: hypothetical protein ABIT71_09515 [Vicinamibacteraceae bacterium]
MTGVLALAQGLGPESFVKYWPYGTVFLGGIMLLALGLIAGRRLFGAPPSHGYVLDINSVAHAEARGARAPAEPAQQTRRAA